MNPTTTLRIVEDDERIRNYMKTILTTCDYAVLETGNARTALSIIASHSPDLMLLDLGYAAEGVGPLPLHSQRKPLSDTVTYL